MDMFSVEGDKTNQDSFPPYKNGWNKIRNPWVNFTKVTSLSTYQREGRINGHDMHSTHVPQSSRTFWSDQRSSWHFLECAIMSAKSYARVWVEAPSASSIVPGHFVSWRRTDGRNKDAQRSIRSVGWRPFMTFSRMAAFVKSSWSSRTPLESAGRVRDLSNQDTCLVPM